MRPLERRADALFSRYIRARDGRCMTGEPGDCWGALECSHILSRRFRSVRWSAENAVTQCAGHADWYTRHPLAWNDWRINYLGAGSFAALIHAAYHGPKPDVALIVEDLKRRMAA